MTGVKMIVAVSYSSPWPAGSADMTVNHDGINSSWALIWLRLKQF
jgi:hypothetical protein